MCEAAGIQNDEFDPIDRGLLDLVDKLVLGITLKAIQLVPELLCELNTAFLDAFKASCAIDIGFT